MNTDVSRMSGPQQFALVILRTLIGWHFLYEGYVKLLHPAWGRDGLPIAQWTSAGYLKAATGPLAGAFHSIADSRWIGSVDLVVAGVLVAIGLSLLLGLFTQTGCAGALVMLSIFYVSAIPLGLPETRAEGSYLIVNKNLVELASVLVVFVFRTGRIAGLDGWRPRSRIATHAVKEATV
jgi:thiosulfate dehydrogenase (quinone) large subunit